MPESAAVALVVVSILLGMGIPPAVRWVFASLAEDHDQHVGEVVHTHLSSADVLDEIKAIVEEAIRVHLSLVPARSDIATLTHDVEQLRAIVDRHETMLNRHAIQQSETQTLIRDTLAQIRVVISRSPASRTRAEDPEPHQVVHDG